MKKLEDMSERIRTSLEKVPGIQYAFIYGPSPKNPADHEREVDIMVLGAPDLFEMDELITKAEERLGRPLLITSFTIREIQGKIRMKDEAVLRALRGHRTMLLGDEQEMKMTLSEQVLN